MFSLSFFWNLLSPRTVRPNPKRTIWSIKTANQKISRQWRDDPEANVWPPSPLLWLRLTFYNYSHIKQLQSDSQVFSKIIKTHTDLATNYWITIRLTSIQKIHQNTRSQFCHKLQNYNQTNKYSINRSKYTLVSFTTNCWITNRLTSTQ